MEATHPGWLVEKEISFDSMCSGAYVGEYLAVSHRWEKPEDPDPEREHSHLPESQMQPNNDSAPDWLH